MKRLTIIILCFFFFNCQKKENQPLAISGEVINYSKDYILLAQDTTGYGLYESIDSLKLDQNGNFQYLPKKKFSSDPILVFDDTKPFQLKLSKFIIDPITLNINLSKLDSLIISGDQAPFIQYHQDQQKYWINIYDDMAKRHPVLAQSDNQKDEYHKIQDTITELRVNYLENYFQDKQIENQAEFIDYEKNSLIYSNLYYRMSGQGKEIIKKLSFYNDSTNYLPNLTYSDQVDFSNKSLFTVPLYREFVIAFLMNDISLQSSKSNQSSYEVILVKGLERIDEWFKTPETNSIAKVIFLHHLLSSAKIFNAQIDFDEFSKTIKDLEEDPLTNNYTPILTSVLTDVERTMAKLSSGSRAPDFELIDEDGQLFKFSGSSNKLIFIDVWASWCKPCITAFPKWNDFVKKNQNNENMEFLTISIDNTPEKWEKGLKKHTIEGINLYAGKGGSNSTFALDYNIKGLPHYLAIDKNGNIITLTSTFSDLMKNTQF